MTRRFKFPFTPKGRPPGSVVPSLLPDGSLECPSCGNTCTTPVAPNPYLGFTPEKMVLVAGKTCKCPHQGCDAVHYFPPELARTHNRFWFKDDPQYASPEDN